MKNRFHAIFDGKVMRLLQDKALRNDSFRHFICHCEQSEAISIFFKFNRKGNRFFTFFYLNIFITLILLSGCNVIKRSKSWAPGLFSMEQIAPNIYVDKDMSLLEREKVKDISKEAEKRMTNFFGKLQSSPRIIACSSDKAYKRFGGFARAISFAGTKVILSPKAITVPLLTHEWTHCEFYNRVGGFLKQKSVPEWFDDGLAVMVSDEPSHSEEVWDKIIKSKIKIPELKKLETLKDWGNTYIKYTDTTINPDHLNVVYSTAGHEVRKWYKNAGFKGLEYVINEIRNGNDFHVAYKKYAK